MSFHIRTGGIKWPIKIKRPPTKPPPPANDQQPSPPQPVRDERPDGTA
jgi:hypothetical protein